MTTIYIASSSGDSIASVEVIKETPKQYQIDEDTLVNVFGHRSYLPSRLDKESYRYRIFAALSEARAWCVEQLQNGAQRLERQLDKQRQRIAELQAQMDGSLPDSEQDVAHG